MNTVLVTPDPWPVTRDLWPVTRDLRIRPAGSDMHDVFNK